MIRNLILLCLLTIKAYAFFPEFKVSYFRYNDKVLREIFGGGDINYQGSLLLPLFCGVNLWGNVGYLHDEGRSLGGGDFTTITLVPATVGLKYVTPPLFYEFQLYGGAGARYVHFSNFNDNDLVERHVEAHAWGGVFSVGSLYRIWNCFYVDLFAEYSLCTLPTGRPTLDGVITYDIDVGGWDFGAGIGYKF